MENLWVINVNLVERVPFFYNHHDSYLSGINSGEIWQKKPYLQ